MGKVTNRTPAEWALFCAEKVMGWTQNPIVEYLWADSTGGIYHINSGDDEQDWSPWHNPADALEVLERLEKRTGRWATLEHVKDLWIVGLGDWEDYVVDAIGPHYGPAVCRLAAKVMEHHKEER